MTKKTIIPYQFLGFLLLLILSFSCNEKSINDVALKKIILRQVGNELLLASNDSTSLILPIKNINDSKFLISFQKELEIHPDTLVSILKRNSKDYINYRVQVLQCKDNEVAYSFEVNADKEKTIIPCSGRLLPKDCYLIEVYYPQNRNSSNNIFYIILLIVLILFSFVFFFKKRLQKSTKPVLENHLIIGSFKFYPMQNKLVKKSEEIALSKKECELLEIFVHNKNEVVKREELTKKVWEDNGVIVGRSLDTYISKLRKKIKSDTKLKLINVHGIGYKLEIKE